MKFGGQSTVLVDRRTKIESHANRNVNLRFNAVADTHRTNHFEQTLDSNLDGGRVILQVVHGGRFMRR